MAEKGERKVKNRERDKEWIEHEQRGMSGSKLLVKEMQI